MKNLLLMLVCFAILMMQGCFNAFNVDEEYCKNNAHLIACFGGEVVWNAALDICQCVCDEGKWGNRCQFNQDDCLGDIQLDDRGVSICNCESLEKCKSKFLVLWRNKFCQCSSSLNENKDAGRNGWLGSSIVDNPQVDIRRLRSDSPDYFPLIIGNIWSYDLLDSTGATTDQFGLGILDSFSVNDTLFYDLGLAIPDSSGVISSFDGPILYNSPEDSNQVYLYYSETRTNLLTYHQFPDTGTYDIEGNQIKIESIGQVSVPAGIFEDCMALTDVLTDNSFIYAPDIGLIKVVSEGVDNMVLSRVIRGCTMSLQATVNHISCGDGDDGAISLTPSGTDEMINYAWSGPTAIDSIPNPQDLKPGIYTVTVSATNCGQIVAEIEILESNVLEVSLSEINGTSCAGSTDGSINITLSGGSEPYTYDWNNGQYTSEDLTDIGAGNYDLTVTDASGCTAFESIQITEPSTIDISIMDQLAVSCQGAEDGSVSLSVSGEAAPLSYSWNNGQYTTKDLTGISGGTYDLVVTDQNGCTKSFSIIVTEPLAIEVALVFTKDVSCSNLRDGSIDIDVTGGTPPYTYNWNDGQYFNEDLDTIPGGTYNLILTDSSGCTEMFSVNIDEPEALSISVVQIVNASCSGISDGSIDVLVSGGTGSYTYAWNENEFTTQDLNNVEAGEYFLVATDESGCFAELMVEVTQPGNLSHQLTTNVSVTCPGGQDGSLGIEGIGGIPPYSYKWNNGLTTAEITGLSPGSYTATITDANGCSVQHTANVTQPDSVQVQVMQENISCSGLSNGTANISPVGGTPPYTYLWSHGQTTSLVNQLDQGSYSATITDAKGCIATLNISLDEPDSISLAMTTLDVSCNGLTDGSTFFEAYGGTPPFSYDWNNGLSGPNQTNLAAGTYEVTATDQNGCTASTPVLVLEPEAIQINSSIVNNACFGQENGSIELTTGGGTSPYSYQWSHGPATQDVAGLKAGSYTVTVTDENLCEDLLTLNIDQPDSLEVEFNISGSLSQIPTGSISMNVSGGTPGYSYQWNDPDQHTTADIDSVAIGMYTVVITDQNGCTTTRTVNVEQSTHAKLLDKNSAIQVFPNPVSDILFIEADEHADALEKYEIYDLSGKLVQKANLSSSKLLNQSIDISLIQDGVYYLILSNQQIQYSTKIMVF